MLEVSALESRYGRIPALKGIDLAVRAGELVAPRRDLARGRLENGRAAMGGKFRHHRTGGGGRVDGGGELLGSRALHARDLAAVEG